MATRTFNLSSVERYTLKADTDAPTTFILGPVDTALMAALEDELMLYKKEKLFQSGETGIILRLNQRYVEFARYGIKGWENLVTADGKQVSFQAQEYTVDRVGVRTGVKEDLLKTLPLEVISELAQRIQELNNLTGDERKN